MNTWLEEVYAVVAKLNLYKRHLAGRSWQNARAPQRLQRVRELCKAGRKAFDITLDYKEKVEEVHNAMEEQSDHWRNGVISMLGCHITTFIDDEPVVYVLDLLSEDTLQDSIWTHNGLLRLVSFLVEKFGRVDDLVFKSDNGSHYHNSYLFSVTLPMIASMLGLKSLQWNFCEPGEGKDVCDGHFGVAGRAFRAASLSGKVMGVQGHVDVLNALNDNTSRPYTVTAEPITIDRTSTDNLLARGAAPSSQR